MKTNLMILSIALAATLLSACARHPSATTPALTGNNTYAGALPPPNHTQQNAAITASTMIAPVRP